MAKLVWRVNFRRPDGARTARVPNRRDPRQHARAIMPRVLTQEQRKQFLLK